MPCQEEVLERDWRNMYIKGKTPEEAAQEANYHRSSAQVGQGLQTSESITRSCDTLLCCEARSGLRSISM